ncbi:hypothetical protein SNE40_005574 [Patella caerulea]|uniref:Apple domain-containing protein n=1 Tax=Patella caerulea TaxID=87958 RepID=A0AAN8K873_PATCE
MMAGWKVLLQVFTLLSYFWIVTASFDSKYIKTQVFREGSNCVKDGFDAMGIMENRSRSLIHCSILCSSTENCRRFMFDKETKLCSMFESGENCITDEEVDNIICYRQVSTYLATETHLSGNPGLEALVRRKFPWHEAVYSDLNGTNPETL